jgi:outer membrane protein assembly factor BamB
MSPIQLAVLALSLAAPAPKSSDLPGQDWPQWRGPNRDGISMETGLLKTWPKEGPKLLWTFEDAGIGFSSFSVAGNRLYTMGAQDPDNGDKEFVLAIDTTTGKEVWRTTIGPFYQNSYGSGPRSTPTIDGDKLYALGAKGDLVCLGAADGTKVWSKNLVSDFGGGVPHWGYSESVLIDGEKLIVTPGGNKGAMVALDKKTGEQIWRCEDVKDGANYSSAIVAEVGGIRHYVQQTNSHVIGVRASDGKLLWQRADIGYRVAVIPTPIFYKDHVFVTSGYGAGCALVKLSKDGDGIKAEKVYENKSIVNHHGGVIRVGEYVCGHSDAGGNWVCLEFLKSDKADGPEPASKFKFDKGSAVCAEGALYCFGQSKGEVVKVTPSPDEWKEEGRFTLPKRDANRSKAGSVWAHPVIAHRKLFLRDQYYLYCYDVAAK